MNIQDQLKTVAEETIRIFAKVADAATKNLARPSLSSESTFANFNSLTSINQANQLNLISGQRARDNETLSREPAFARVVVTDESGDKKTYYFCRVAPPSDLNTDKILLASYRAPVGRLLERDPLSERDTDVADHENASAVEDERTLFIGGQSKTVWILEFAEYQPVCGNGEWDADGRFLYGVDYGRWPFKSLREFIGLSSRDFEPVPDVPSVPVDGGFDDALLDKILSDEEKKDIARESIRRNVISKMELRDQPILDRYQGDIFRLPLNSRLLILGAPGTGKTTTLIRRLGQKLDAQFLDAEELRSIDAKAPGWESTHAENWIMFTPTDLLKFYVKEAFNLENIPASDDRIRTWDGFRLKLAREKFGILQTATGRSSYIMKNDARTLMAKAETASIEWFTDFDQFQRSSFWEDMRVEASNLRGNSAPEVARIGAKICEILGPSGMVAQQDALVSLIVMDSELRAPAKNMKNATDKKIRGALNRQVNQNHEFLNDLAEFIEKLADLDDAEDQDIEEENTEDSDQPRVGPRAAAADYMRAVSSQARAQARGRQISKNSRAGRIIEWLGDRSLPEQELLDVGKSLVVQSALRRFVNPARRYINRIPNRYRRFRRMRRTEKRWYCAEGLMPAEVHPLEVDVILLAMIRSSNDLIRSARTISDDNPAHLLLARMHDLHHTQVLADEATDFSPVQLAAMAGLAHPRTRSFFACGDFNQRMTSWGTRSKEEMRWAVPDLDVRSISVAYRQSQQLHDLAVQIANISGDGIENVKLPVSMDNQGVSPILAMNMAGEQMTANWLAMRIREIEGFVRELPSIAVLVNSEEEVISIAKMLGDELIKQNIPVIPCPNGRVPSQDGAVFVFNVQHIKGLEFEAVFFIGVDKLAENQPDLFDKRLYVGATRAAAYFGITCEGPKLPQKMAELRELFQDGWQD
ncbi:MAG: ATP-binding domain-containing protein [Gammaproteobacteria bacterium]